MTDHQFTAIPDHADRPGAIRLSQADTSALLAFYVALGDSERYARFGGSAASALAVHCDTLDWANTAVFAWTSGAATAVAEVHLSTPAHAAVELAVACTDHYQARSAWRYALGLAVSAAAGRGCGMLHVPLEPGLPWLAGLLREVGTLRLTDDTLVCTLPRTAQRGWQV